MNKALKKQLKRDMPRGIIFFIDLGIVSISYIASSVILTNFFGEFSLTLMIKKLIIVLVAYTLGFIVFKPFKGVIRQTGVKDIENIIITCLFSGTLLAIVSGVQRGGYLGMDYEAYLRFSYSLLLLHLLFTSVILILARLFYSEFYRSFILEVRKEKRVIIYGAGDSGVMTSRVLASDTKIRTCIFGLVDDNPSKWGNRLKGYKIYNPSVLTAEFIERNRINEIIISIQNISSEKLNNICSVLENLPVKIKIIPPATDWMNGSYSNKQIKTLKIEDLLGRETIQLQNPIVSEELKNKVVVITGAAGSIGSEIARQIIRFEFKTLVLIDHAESALYDMQQIMVSNNKANVKYIVGNIRDEKVMESVFESIRPDLVYHAAAYKHVPLMENYPYEAVHTNVQGTKIIADLSVKYGVAKFVMVSTDKAVNPTNVMGATKRAAELYVSCLQGKGRTNFIVTRFGNVLGSNGSVIPLFKRQIAQGGPLTVTHKDITRYFMTIPEACQLVLEASVMGKGGEIFVFDMGKSVKIVDLAKRMIKLSGYNYPEDIDISIVGLRPGEKIYEELLANGENTVKTHHDKIMIASVRNHNLVVTKEALDRLCDTVVSDSYFKDSTKVVKQLKMIVPEFKSQNSNYEILDEEAVTL